MEGRNVGTIFGYPVIVDDTVKEIRLPEEAFKTLWVALNDKGEWVKND